MYSNVERIRNICADNYCVLYNFTVCPISRSFSTIYWYIYLKYILYIPFPSLRIICTSNK